MQITQNKCFLALNIVFIVTTFIIYYRYITNKIIIDIRNNNNDDNDNNHNNITSTRIITFSYYYLNQIFSKKYICEIKEYTPFFSKFEDDNACGIDHQPCKIGSMINPVNIWIFANQYDSEDCIIVSLNVGSIYLACNALMIASIIIYLGFIISRVIICVFCSHYNDINLNDAIRIHPYNPYDVKLESITIKDKDKDSNLNLDSVNEISKSNINNHVLVLEEAEA
jgi:hypothetical protein